MILNTKRLKLRELSLADLEQIHQLHLLPEVDEFNTTGIPENIDVTKLLITEWMQRQKITPRISYIFCMELLETSSFIGLIALNIGKPNYRSGETWYKIHPDYWRKGYTTEALMGLLKYSFNHLKLHRIEAGCAVKNIASMRVLEKVGMTREGIKREILPIRGQWFDGYFYSILEKEFQD